MKNQKAFTLIELLIVVLIIAILAAIAVPNFLEFQIRAKISRTMSDMRSMSVAIEAYTVDNDREPLDRVEWTSAGVANPPGFDPNSNLGQFAKILVVVTTPIAYMSQLPVDVFIESADPSVSGNGSQHSWYVTKNGYGGNQGSGRGSVETHRLFHGPREKFNWGLISPCVDGHWEWDKVFSTIPEPYYGDVVYYDPTNGTVSVGDLYLYGSGNEFFPQPPTPHL